MRTALTMFLALAGLCAAAAGQSGTVTLTPPQGNETVPGGLRVTVDAYGTFSSALFKPAPDVPAADTTRYSSIFLSVGGVGEFLDADWLGAREFDTWSTSSAMSSFTRYGLEVQLRQQVAAIAAGSRLSQTYTLRNTTAQPVVVTMTRYLDGDLLFDGDDNDGAAVVTGSPGQWLVQFDRAGSLQTPMGYLAASFSGGQAPSGHFEIGPYWDIFQAVDSGGPLKNLVNGDLTGNLHVDAGEDIALALRRELLLAPGETGTIVALTDFGYGAPGELVPEPATGLLLLAGTGLLARRRRLVASR